ncbi:MAG: glycosyltransferase family 4 protein [Janthinobacterium lividum]
MTSENGKGELDEARAVPLFMSEIEQFGGAERSILALGRWLHQQGHPVYLLTYADHAGMEQYAGFPLQKVELKPGNSVRSKIAALRKHFAAKPRSAPPPIVSGYQPALHATLAGIGKFHCLMHDTPALFGDTDLSWKQRARQALSNRLIGFGMRRGHGTCIVTSNFLQSECFRDFGIEAEIARMGGLQGHAFRRRPVTTQLRMLSVCRIEPNKRIDWMLDALASLEGAPVPLSSRVDWRLDLAGRGSLLQSMTSRARELGLADRVTFHGFVSDAEVEQLYDNAHLFLMPAVQGYGIPAIEALQRGIPVLLHRESGVSDLLLDTPWAQVLHGGKEELRPKLAAMLDWLIEGGQLSAPMPAELPTEASWAKRVAMLCHYVAG